MWEVEVPRIPLKPGWFIPFDELQRSEELWVPSKRKINTKFSLARIFWVYLKLSKGYNDDWFQLFSSVADDLESSRKSNSVRDCLDQKTEGTSVKSFLNQVNGTWKVPFCCLCPELFNRKKKKWADQVSAHVFTSFCSYSDVFAV